MTLRGDSNRRRLLTIVPPVDGSAVAPAVVPVTAPLTDVHRDSGNGAINAGGALPPTVVATKEEGAVAVPGHLLGMPSKAIMYGTRWTNPNPHP